MMTGSTLMPGHAPLKDHPLANLFPLLPEKELSELADDIAENGQAETIKLHRGMILDGRNRYRACALKNQPVRTEIFQGDDRAALAYVVSKNLKRRHMDESQRAMVAARLAKLKLGANQHTRAAAQICAPTLPGVEAPAASPIVAQGEAAALLNVSRRSLQSAAAVQEKGTPELQQAVDEGRVAVSTAADIAALPIEEQKKIVAAADKNVVKEVAKKARDEKNKKRRDERVEKWKKQAEGNAPLATATKFQIIYFDPATRYAAGDSDRSTENHYQTMTEEEIAALPIGELATSDAILLMWTTVPWLRKSIRLIESWGFEYKSCAVWDKEDIGLGFWWQNQHEILIAATRGKPVAPENGSILGRSLYREKKGLHSTKPLYFRDMIDRVPEWADLNKVELFARVDGPMPGNWKAWGNEANVPQQQSFLSEAAE